MKSFPSFFKLAFQLATFYGCILLGLAIHYQMQVEDFENDFDNAFHFKEKELLEKYDTVSFSDKELSKMDEVLYFNFLDLEYEWQSIVDSIDNINSAKLKLISQGYDYNLIISQYTCYKVVFNQDEDAKMILCTEQNFGNTTINYITYHYNPVL